MTDWQYHFFPGPYPPAWLVDPACARAFACRWVTYEMMKLGV